MGEQIPQGEGAVLREKWRHCTLIKAVTLPSSKPWKWELGIMKISSVFACVSQTTPVLATTTSTVILVTRVALRQRRRTPPSTKPRLNSRHWPHPHPTVHNGLHQCGYILKIDVLLHFAYLSLELTSCRIYVSYCVVIILEADLSTVCCWVSASK